MRTIFEHVLKLQRSPTIEELESSLRKQPEEIIRIVGELEKKDVLLRKRGTQEIASIYPFSLIPTKHQMVLEDGTKLFAMCAIDALGTPIMFAKDAKIVSQCEVCGQELIIEIKNEEIGFISHPDMVICRPEIQVYPAAVTCCPLINFFCSKKHANDWIAENSGRRRGIGQRPVKLRFPEIRERWKRYGEMLGFR
nr:organomercurial lyase [Candidatus Njordarchaeum guaymaensis]